MTALRRALLLVTIAGAGLSIYFFFFFFAPRPVQAFDAILNLTPGELELHCGTPAQDTMGVVADGAGIRDLHYGESGNTEMVFRFISADDKSWQSLGAWEKVRAPDFLGSPVDAQVASRAMGCVAREDSHSLLAPWQHGGAVRSGLAPELAFVSPQAIQEMMMPGQHQGPPPMPSTLPPGAATPSKGPSHSEPSVIRIPESQWSRPPKAYYPAADDAPHFRSAPRCPPGTGACVDYSEFVAAMEQVIVAERQGDFQSAVDRLARHGEVVVRLPGNEQNRVEGVRTVVRLEVKAFNIVEERLRDEITRLEPRRGDSADKAARKIVEMRREDNLRRALWSQAVESNGPAQAAVASGTEMRFNGAAYQRMVQIVVSGVWR